jgi:hypothetical protein
VENGQPEQPKSKPILLRELSELKGSEIILKFHWVDGLTTHPLTKLEWVNLADDPIPFIKLVNPPAALTLSVESSLRESFCSSSLNQPREILFYRRLGAAWRLSCISRTAS